MLLSPSRDWIAQMSYKRLSKYEKYQIMTLLQARSHAKSDKKGKNQAQKMNIFIFQHP